MGYNAYFAGQNMLFFLIMTYLNIYLTNTLGIPVVTVGTIFLIARVWDAVNDPLMSILVEKAHFKGGKFKPWVKGVAIVLPLFTIVLFSFTNVLVEASMGVRITFALVTYIIWGMIYTISDAPAFALSTAMTDNSEERTSIIASTRLFAMLGIVMLMVIINPILKMTDDNWFLTSAIVSCIAMILLLGINFTKERRQSRTETPGLKSIIRAIVSNKYLVIYVIAYIAFMATNFTTVLNAYISTDLLENSALIPIITIVTMAPVLFIAPFLPKILKKVSKITIIRAVFGVTVLLSLAQYFIGYDNFALFMVLIVLRGLFFVPINIISALFFIDCIEYSENTTGDRFEAATFSAQTFSAKAGQALAGTLSMWLIGLAGYVSSTSGEEIVQTQEALDGVWAVYTITPAIGAAIAFILFTKLYNLTEAKVDVMANENKSKRG